MRTVVVVHHGTSCPSREEVWARRNVRRLQTSRPYLDDPNLHNNDHHNNNVSMVYTIVGPMDILQ